MKLQTVEDFFNKKRKTIEKYNYDKIAQLGWQCPDVLYSFRGVYAIGVFIYYQYLFRNDVIVDIILKETKDGAKQFLYSDKFLREHYTEFSDVNELSEIKLFLQRYYNIGNIIPTWPGANVNRGMSHCYDIPNIYYKRHQKLTKLIYGSIYKNVFLDKVFKDNKYDTVEKLLKLDKHGYIDFLRYVISVIEERTDLLESVLRKRGKL